MKRIVKENDSNNLNSDGSESIEDSIISTVFNINQTTLKSTIPGGVEFEEL